MMKKCKLRLLRLCALLLTAASLLSVMPVSILATDTASEQITPSPDAPKIMVLHNGAEEVSVALREDGRETLEAFITGIDSGTLSWQILTPDGGRWVNIFAKTQNSLTVTYSLVGSMLNSEGRAYIRCTLKDGEELHISDPVEIVMSYAASDTEVIDKLSYESSPMLLSASRAMMASTEAAADTEEGTDTEAGTDTETDGELTLYTVVINYIFDNGGMAFEPYGASIAAGSSFIQSIPSPMVVGYEPFIRDGGSYESAATVDLNIEKMDSNVVINVIYEPALVEFQVHHHFQDIYDDNYSTSPNEVTKSQALTGSVTPTTGLALDKPGFKVLTYESVTVAADGSTVVEIRYDRNYYLVDFAMDGGWGTEPVYTRFGSEVGANAPTRHGYVFDGWELASYGGATPTAEQASQYDINATGTIIVPDANLTYKAKWITQETTYTMVFWMENINDNGFTYWGYLEGLAAMSGTLVSGADRVGEIGDIEDVDMFTYSDALTDKDVLVEGDGSTIVNVYYTRNRYSITFKATGTCVIPEDHIHSDACNALICNKGHVHTDACNPTLICTTPVHEAHTAECITCGIEEHSHSTACCSLTEHTHTMACWSNYLEIADTATTNLRNAPASPVQGQIFRGRAGTFGWYRYYIYLYGSWYQYDEDDASSGDIADPECGYLAEHTHGSADCSCTQTPHSHTDTCYSDALHTHGEDCYSYSCGDDPHTHTAGCYILNCGIPEGHTHTTACNNANRTNTVKIVYKKYQQDLSDIWPIEDDHGVIYDDGQRWEPSDSSDFTEVLVFIANMPGDEFTLTLNESNTYTYTMNYYLEVLPWEAEAGKYEVQYNGRYFNKYTTVAARYNHLTEAEDFFDINGYYQLESAPAFSNGQISTGGGEVDLYYGRNVTQKLEFQSSGIILTDKTKTGIMYGDSLTEYSFTPDYPTNLEENAYVFDGWYTSPGHYDGTEVDWATATMAAGDVMFYAKWSPIVHKVNIYLTSELDTQIGETQYVSHKNFAAAPTETVANGNYIFQGWFYKDGEEDEKAFVFSGIPITDDMDIYAKWSSHVSVRYTINYVLQKTGEKIADTLEGSAIAGHNLTFEAKAGAELYAGYQTGYYPLANSHTVTMSAEGDHEYTFEYVFVESMPYLVKYVDKNGKEVAAAKTVMDNNLSVVTETFVKVDKMMPDAYQKRLVLSADGTDSDGDGILDNNVITFNYEENTENAYYRVVHYIQNISADGYREYRSEDTVGDIGKDYTVSAITLEGFAFNGALTKLDGTLSRTDGNSVTATLDADGMLIEFYYDRVNVSYIVNYLESGTNAVLHDPKTGTGIFGGQVVEQAPGLVSRGYTLQSESIKQLHLSTDPDTNVINFYYTEATYSIQYQIVGSTDGGSLSTISENIKAATGVPAGSSPTVFDGYHFVGWYLDEACTKPVPTELVDANNHITPESDEEVWLSNHTYYAKIDPDFTTLTITVKGADMTLDASQVFVYNVRGVSEENADVDVTVTVSGNSSVTLSELRLGEYTVTELTEWSFRYDPDAVSKNVTLGVDKDANSVTFNHARSNTKWLDGSNGITNKFD